uniref:PsbP domain-containing protein n=1 Tax=Elaeophora elaphi TaxID=1147741 RepID=A0A0R3RX26_9BILA
MSYGELREAFAPGPSTIVSVNFIFIDMVKQNDGEILGPLEIDVSEMATTTYGYDPKKLQRESAELLHHSNLFRDKFYAFTFNSFRDPRKLTIIFVENPQQKKKDEKRGGEAKFNIY